MNSIAIDFERDMLLMLKEVPHDKWSQVVKIGVCAFKIMNPDSQQVDLMPVLLNNDKQTNQFGQTDQMRQQIDVSGQRETQEQTDYNNVNGICDRKDAQQLNATDQMHEYEQRNAQQLTDQMLRKQLNAYEQIDDADQVRKQLNAQQLMRNQQQMIQPNNNHSIALNSQFFDSLYSQNSNQNQVNQVSQQEESMRSLRQSLSDQVSVIMKECQSIRESQSKYSEMMFKSQKKGKFGEDQIENIIIQSMPNAKILQVAHQSHCGDIIVQLNQFKVLIEVKNYDQSVPTKEVTKFIDDVQYQDVNAGILISLGSRITGKQSADYEISESGKHLIYLSSLSIEQSFVVPSVIYLLKQTFDTCGRFTQLDNVLAIKTKVSINIDQQLKSALLYKNYLIKQLTHIDTYIAALNASFKQLNIQE